MAYEVATGARLAMVEEAAVAALTLVEGLEAEQLMSSRLTRLEIQRQLLLVASVLGDFGPLERTFLPELDWEGWAAFAAAIGTNSTNREALWVAVQSLAPITLSWLRIYRRVHAESP